MAPCPIGPVAGSGCVDASCGLVVAAGSAQPAPGRHDAAPRPWLISALWRARVGTTGRTGTRQRIARRRINARSHPTASGVTLLQAMAVRHDWYNTRRPFVRTHLQPQPATSGRPDGHHDRRRRGPLAQMEARRNTVASRECLRLPTGSRTDKVRNTSEDIDIALARLSDRALTGTMHTDALHLRCHPCTPRAAVTATRPALR